MSTIEQKFSDEQLQIIGKVLIEKFDSLSSKAIDETATSNDQANLEFAKEVVALAKNRLFVQQNEALAQKGEDVWTERTSESHYPHIRLHGGVIEDDLPT
ncbi:conserved hypothetical protein [Chloroherpeton thalassium ATCC 35110]|uniref:Uncharacterized protein n=1 Tax=Chloroherpeton thalassium (strain ATCC 35110 / GB-78) TaxID=517418 RepID=B3QT59_CHLT3|nr:hypothetical protein [Chloroherpeton thalassium]ACF14158.1 conserved hypothetical protein [Chloroherpeton thalassium ATCC 35110]